MNHIVLIGRPTRDTELRYTQNGTAVANFDLAVDRPGTNPQGEREADFIRCVAWQKQAEVAANYVTKGRLIAVEGRLQIRSYEAQDGSKRRQAEVILNNIQFLDSNRENTGGTAPGGTTAPVSNNTEMPPIANDDLPF
jgi:single-strand DNA-binding protein